MTDAEIAEYKETSKIMFDDLCNPESLVHINLYNLTFNELVHRFLSTKASKTDFSVLIGALEFWDRETSTIHIESYSYYRSITESTLANANLSRALKNLEEYGFIKKVSNHNNLEYFFDIPFSILQSEFGANVIK
tara:strand:- start:46 stop:450 length:405 start_codon:yes stop_codon:yes gene_type:complete